MIQSVAVSNLRGIQSGVLGDLAPLTVLVGPNGCGKSTVLESLLVGASPKPGDAIGRAVRRHPFVPTGSRWLFTNSDGDRGCEITVTLDGGVCRKSRVYRDPTFQGGIRLYCEITDGNETERGKVWTTFDPENRYNFDPQFIPLSGVPEVRIVEAPSAGFQPPLHELYTRTVEQGRRRIARDITRTVVPALDEIEILTEGSSPVLHLVFRDHSVPAALCGDGIHSLLRLVLELASRPDGLVLLEEPEVHQHPKAIRQSAAAIVSAVQRDIQIVLTTHSLELIDALVLAAEVATSLDKLAVFRLMLDAGKLASSRFPGLDVAFARKEIEDDLR